MKRRLSELPTVLIEHGIVRALLLAYRPVRCEAKPSWTFEGCREAYPGHLYDPFAGLE